MPPNAPVPCVSRFFQGECGVDDYLDLALAHECCHRLQILEVVAHVEILERDFAEGEFVDQASAYAREGGGHVDDFGFALQLGDEFGGRHEVCAVQHEMVFAAGGARVGCALGGLVVQHLIRPQTLQELHVACPARHR